MTVAACAALVERGDPDRFRAVMAAPVAARARLFPIHAFNLEVARAPWVTAEPLIAEMRLQWWRDTVAGGAVRAHEVAGPLAGVVRDCALPLDVMDRLIAARQWDIYRAPFADAASFAGYLDDTGAGLMWLAARALGAPDAAEAPVRDLGWAAALAAWLRAVPELEARGRVPLLDGRPEAVAALAQQGLDRLARARGARGLVPGAVAPALLTGWQTGALLGLVKRDPRAVAEGRVGQSEVMARGRLLWLAATGRW